ncbi:MAG: alpha/beta fold hydrolase BchO [Pseudomonadota bacterium]
MILAPEALSWERDGADWPNRSMSRFREVAGRRWHLQRGGPAGTAKRILLLHGVAAATHSWRDVLPDLVARHQVLALDLPGHGLTSRGSIYRYALPAVADDISAVLTAETFEPDLVVGHSAGAAIALEMVRRGLVRRVPVLAFNGALRPFQGLAGTLFPAMAKILSLNPVVAPFFARTASDLGTVRQLLGGTGSRLDARGVELYALLLSHPAHVRAALDLMSRWDLAPLAEALPHLDVPITLVTALDDRAVPPAEAHRVAALAPDATVVEVPGHGHLMHEEDPPRAIALIEAALGA